MDEVREGGRVEEREEIDRWRERADGRDGGCEERTGRGEIIGNSKKRGWMDGWMDRWMGGWMGG